MSYLLFRVLVVPGNGMTTERKKIRNTLVRYAFVSDIHANLHAWKAVWADIGAQQVDEVICLGDVVGYGPHPEETLSSVYANVSRATLGNHDAVMFGMLDLELFNDSAQEMIAWTMEELEADTVMLLADTPHTQEIDCGDFTAIATHASMHEPEAFNYVFTEADARLNWKECGAPLIFVGHTHEPRVDYLDPEGNYNSRYAESLTFQHGYRCIINVGSVGMPRTGDPRACYVIFDTETKELAWRRVEYDVDALVADIHKRIGNSAAAKQALMVFDSENTFAPEEDFAPPQITVSKKTVARARNHAQLKEPSQKRMGNMTVVLVALAVAVTGLLACGIFYGMMRVSKNREKRKLDNTRAKVLGRPEPRKKEPVAPKKDPVPEPPRPQRQIKVGNMESRFNKEEPEITHTIVDYVVPSGGGRKLVLVASWHNVSGNITAKWRGKQEFKTVAWNENDALSATILYLDNPKPGNGNIEVAFKRTTRSRIGVVMLTGFAEGYSVKSVGTAMQGKLKTSAPNTLVIGACTFKDGETLVPPTLKGEIYRGPCGQSRGHAGYKLEREAGKKTYIWKDESEDVSSNVLVGFVPAGG